MMLTIMHRIVPNRKQRLILGAAIIIAANCGGAMTVIGEPAGLFLWNLEAVTATSFSMTLFIPCLVACGIPIYMLGRLLPERVETEWIPMPYRGEDTRLNVWQRLVMLFVGIGGLWFIPSFHHLTKLSPFLGALCVLAVLWIVNEIFNRKLVV
jgi:Na+/H+ antiporter NhaD/arsenite permease-like protein